MAFEAFASERNFTRGARKLGLSQPALFERVQRLAAAIEAPLYEKSGRELHLTQRGEDVLAYARESLTRAESFTRSLRHEPASAEVTLAAGEGAYLYLLGPAIKSFGRESRLKPLTLGAAPACAAVVSGEADLAVAVADLVPSRLVADDLVRTPLCVALPRKHPLARRPRVTLVDLTEERWIITPPGQLHRDFLGRAVARLGRELSDPIEADGWPLMLRFVELGLGVAIVNGICTPPRGVTLRPLAELGSITYRLLRRRGAERSPAARHLAQRILALKQG